MQVCHLEDDALFVLLVEGGHRLYVFVKNECREDGVIEHSIIREICSYWPDNARGQGIPGHWYSSSGGDTKCNPYAEVKLMKIIEKDS